MPLGGLLIQESANDAADAADVHNAGNTQVQVAGLFGDGLTGGAKEQRDALHHSPGDKGNKVKHYFSSFPPALRREIL